MDDAKDDDMNLSESEELENSENYSDNEVDTTWNIKYKEESNFIMTLIKQGYTYNPTLCPLCNNGLFELKEYNNNNILKIYYCRCKNMKCRKKTDLRHISILKIGKNIPASIFFKIYNWFFLTN